MISSVIINGNRIRCTRFRPTLSTRHHSAGGFHSALRMVEVGSPLLTGIKKMTKGGICFTVSVPGCRSVQGTALSWPMLGAVQVKTSGRIATVLHFRSQPGFKAHEKIKGVGDDWEIMGTSMILCFSLFKGVGPLYSFEPFEGRAD